MGIFIGTEFHAGLRVVFPKSELRGDFFHVAKTIAPDFQSRDPPSCVESISYHGTFCVARYGICRYRWIFASGGALKVSVLKNEKLSSEVFGLELEKPANFNFLPGQALKLRVPDAQNPERSVDKYFSIASPPEQASLYLCIKQIGSGTAYLANLGAGDILDVDGPVGEFVLRPEPARHFVFICIGTGIAPFRSMVLSNHYRDALPPSTTLIAGFRKVDDVLFNKEFVDLDYVSWIPALSEGLLDGSFKGRVTAYLSEAEIPFADSEFYICGSADLVGEVRNILSEKHVAEAAIHHEPYLYPKKKK